MLNVKPDEHRALRIRNFGSPRFARIASGTLDERSTIRTGKQVPADPAISLTLILPELDKMAKDFIARGDGIPLPRKFSASFRPG